MNSLDAQLVLAYKRFQWYADILGNLIDGIDDQFIIAYDNKDIKDCKAALVKISDILNSDAGAIVYRTWRNRNEEIL